MKPSPRYEHLPKGTRVVTTGGRWPNRPAEVVRCNGAQIHLRILLADGMSWRAVRRHHVRRKP